MVKDALVIPFFPNARSFSNGDGTTEQSLASLDAVSQKLRQKTRQLEADAEQLTYAQCDAQSTESTDLAAAKQSIQVYTLSAIEALL